MSVQGSVFSVVVSAALLEVSTLVEDVALAVVAALLLEVAAGSVGTDFSLCSVGRVPSEQPGNPALSTSASNEQTLKRIPRSSFAQAGPLDTPLVQFPAPNTTTLELYRVASASSGPQAEKANPKHGLGHGWIFWAGGRSPTQAREDARLPARQSSVFPSCCAFRAGSQPKVRTADASGLSFLAGADPPAHGSVS
jgi:hypothetical protein